MARVRKDREREDAHRLAAYHAAKSDKEAARRLRVSAATFGMWRRARGLPPKGRGGPRTPGKVEVRRLRVYQETKSDAEAARKLGMLSQTFSAWRRARGLPSKRRTNRKEVDIQRLLAYRQTKNDKEAAAKLGISAAAFRAWRHSRGLPSRLRRSQTKARARRLKARKKNLNAAKTAR